MGGAFSVPFILSWHKHIRDTYVTSDGKLKLLPVSQVFIKSNATSHLNNYEKLSILGLHVTSLKIKLRTIDSSEFLLSRGITAPKLLLEATSTSRLTLRMCHECVYAKKG